MTLALIVLILVVAFSCLYMAQLISDVTAHPKHAGREPGSALGIGIFSFFQFLLSAFGLSDFAIGATVYSKLKWVSAKKLPGTVNASAVIPTSVMALVYITSIQVDLPTLIVPILAQVAGAYAAPRFAVKMPARPIRVFFVAGMVFTVLRIAAENFGFFPVGGSATGLDMGRLVLFGLLCLAYGILNNFGIGSFAPTIVTVHFLGLNPVVAFPIMMGATALSMSVASIQFIRHDSYSRKITVVSTVCGTMGVLAAAFPLRDMDISPVEWLVAVFLLYGAGNMFRAAFRGKEDDVIESGPVKPEQTQDSLPVIRTLTSFCLALILVCTVSLIVVFIRNLHTISSGYVEASIGEYNARLGDSVRAYLRAHEGVLLSARAGVAQFMSREPIERERLRAYLEESSRALPDISTLYCTTNGVWNKPGGYAVFSRPWDVPEDWNNTERLWFVAAKKAGEKIAYSRPYLDALTGDIILDISINVYDEAGRDIGVISEAITIESLAAMLRRTTVEGQRIFLMDGDGIFVVHPNREMVGQGNFFTATGLEEYRGAILSGGHVAAADKGMAVYSAPIPATGWIVASIIPTAEISSSINSQLTGIFLTPMLIILFMLLVVLISLRIIIRSELTAERLAKAKDAFIARMSHEIRTPMNAVIGMAELAERDWGKPKTISYIRGIRNAGVSLLAIINDILDFSRIGSGRLELARAPYRTASMLADVMALIRVQIAEKPLELLLDAGGGIPAGLEGDAVRVKQVLLNLLGNAVKYSGQGTVRLAVSGERLTEHTARVSFVVEDNGIGVRPEDMARLFGDFTRLDEKRNSAIEGTGLGLSIARSLCRAMGGDITASSVYGEGSVFTATLIQDVADWSPMEDADATAATGAGLPHPSFTAPEASMLVADDVRNNLAVTEGLLSPYAMRVTTAANGREAVELARENSFDLVLMDHMMPEMDGMEAVAAIRALGGKFLALPVVALTAHAVSGMKERFLAAGFDDFLSKPVDAAALDAVLLRWIPGALQRSAPAGTREEPAPASPDMAGATKAELAEQQFDLLKHFRWHFENGVAADGAYCEKFSALIEAMDVPPPARAVARELAAAGWRGDTDAIGRMLPDFCEAVSAPPEENGGEGAYTAERLMPVLARLAAALDKGDGADIDAAMRSLREMEGLDAPARELYFHLNDAYLIGEPEKASAKLAEWMQTGRRNA